jgi:hypothetical protein
MAANREPDTTHIKASKRCIECLLMEGQCTKLSEGIWIKVLISKGVLARMGWVIISMLTRGPDQATSRRLRHRQSREKKL